MAPWHRAIHHLSLELYSSSSFPRRRTLSTYTITSCAQSLPVLYIWTLYTYRGRRAVAGGENISRALERSAPRLIHHPRTTLPASYIYAAAAAVAALLLGVIYRDTYTVTRRHGEWRVCRGQRRGRKKIEDWHLAYIRICARMCCRRSRTNVNHARAACSDLADMRVLPLMTDGPLKLRNFLFSGEILFTY